MLKVSFVIPTKNSDKFIEQCLTSILQYYYKGYIADIVIVDGISSDNTLEKANKFPVKIIFDDSGFPAPSWEKGWRNAKGDLIVFFDSDAYLGDGYLPKLLDFFDDDKVGIISCEAIPIVIGGKLSLAEKQWSLYNHEMRFAPEGLLQKFFHHVIVQKFFHRVIINGNSLPPPSGPCWVARRSSIEKADGYRGLLCRSAPDVSLPYRIIEEGWDASWWLGSPVYHYTRATIKSLVKRCAHHGREAALWMRDVKWSPLQQFVAMVPELGSPIVGLAASIRFKNPWVFVFSFSRYVNVLGYIGGTFSKGDERIT